MPIFWFVGYMSHYVRVLYRIKESPKWIECAVEFNNCACPNELNLQRSIPTIVSLSMTRF